jgi:Tfp pilus assembly PilM family ATPase
MAKFIALEWDNLEARIAVANSSGQAVELLHALTVDLTGTTSRNAAQIGQLISQALQPLGLSSSSVLVAVGRLSTELRFLKVPPVPPEELPDLVRFQAERQFSQSLAEAGLDFVPLECSGNPPSKVLATAIASDNLKHILDICAFAGLSPKHIVLRPFAIAPLLPVNVGASTVGALAIDLLAEEADLTIMLGAQAVYPRTTRMSHAAEDLLVMEARRTMAAARNEIPEADVQTIYLFGKAHEQVRLQELLARELKLPVKVIDPLEQVTLTTGFALPANTQAGRFAPLIGLLLEAARGQQHEIDFLSPRKRPVPPDNTRLYSLASAFAAVVALAFVALIYWQLSELQSEADRLATEIKQTDKSIKAGKATLENAKLLDDYANSQISWLSELERLAQKLPPADQVLLNEIKAGSGAQGGQLILLGGTTADDGLTKMRAALRDETHRISGPASNKSKEATSHPYLFEEVMTFTPNTNTGAKP